ncbi:MAG: helix-turn-helix domain-containing protein [Candidatus Dormibacteraeota bacterium]|nr:helix-turn-helix domain-containing protein [Candidatus Dormibacteraeota bacterium]
MSGTNVLRLIRTGQGKTRRECARDIHVDEATWKRWELGLLAPSSANLLDIAAYLGVPAESLRPITRTAKHKRGATNGSASPVQRRSLDDSEQIRAQ